ENEIRLFPQGGFHSGPAVFGGNRMVFFQPQDGRKVAAHLRFVLDDQNRFHESGMVTVKVVPPPCRVSTEIRPRWSSTLCFTMTRPRPVPGVWPTFDPRRNASNSD